MPDENPFYRKYFWYQCALVEFRYFREEAESLARSAIKTMQHRWLVPNLPGHSTSFLSSSGSENIRPVDFTLISGKKQFATEDGAYLVYSVDPTGAVAIFLKTAQSEVMKANERFVLLHIGPLSAYQLRSRLRRDLRDLVAYNYATTLDGEPTLRERIRIRWITSVKAAKSRRVR